MATEAEIRKRAEEAAKRTAQMPDGVKYAVVTVLANIRNGAFWGFTDMQDIKKHVDVIRQNAPNIVARKLGNACIIEVLPQYMLSAVQAIDPQAISQQMYSDMLKKQAEAKVSFERFLIRSGRSIEKTGRPFMGTIGLYCTNDVSTMSYKGVQYPAFRVTLAEALGFLHRYGYSIKVGGSFVPAGAAGSGVWDSMLLLPTKNGVLVDIRADGTADQYRNAEKQYRAANKI